jgi:putative hydrolase of the HAD superfamily
MSIKAIGFDYLGVTALLPDRDIFAIVGELVSRPLGQVKNSYYAYAAAFQKNLLTHEQLWSNVASDLGVSDKLSDLLQLVTRDLPVVDQDVLAMVDNLRSSGYKVGLLSNLASGTDWDADLRAQGVDMHFDAVVLSGDIGYSKPHPRCFEVLAERLDIATNELVFIDDRESSLVGVQDIGVVPIVYTGKRKLTDDLVALGIIKR